MKKQKTYILQIEKDDPKKELDFEITFQLSLTEKQRYNRMIQLFKKTMNTLKKHDYTKTLTIISRS